MNSVDFEAVWNALPQPALLFGLDDAVIAANAAAEAFFSSSVAHLMRRRLGDFASEASRLADLAARARSGAVSLADRGIELIAPDGKPRTVDVQLAALDSEGGGLLLLIQPRSIAEQMDRSLTHRAAARSVTGMAAMLAHEIKNPLAGISGAAQLLEMSLGDPERELTTLIREESKRVEKLLERVEAFGDTRPRPKAPLNIHDVIDRAQRAAEAGFARHVRFFTEFDPSLPPIPGDPDTLMQVFQNLLKNAAEATPQVGGVIMIRTAYSPGVAIAGLGGGRESVPLLVSIQDNGSGVPPEIKPDIFEPFVTSKAAGSGLGLALVSKVMADHGGVVECDSEPGWTVMRLRFPVWREARSKVKETAR
ncbi:MAG: nitrogen regulation protein NR(II) [Rubrimonas sp.]|uniref:two-component system sensor histidine kinase NtrB n=1 Tax=Rubrimonas sp. TaxID=2036015 RepID=UPI002FDD64A4